MSKHHISLGSLAQDLGQRRDAILRAWEREVAVDPLLVSGASLPRHQLRDHLPTLLDAFEDRLRASTDAELRAACREQRDDASAHGMHRWQQGFNLREVVRELGRFNECVVSALDQWAHEDGATRQGVASRARLVWAESYGLAVNSSINRYVEMKQLEAATHITELESALGNLKELENRRATLWHQAAHDLRGNLNVMTSATSVLSTPGVSSAARDRFLSMLERNVESLARLLEDLTDYARLQGGRERRTVASFDAAIVLRGMGESMQPLAAARGLELTLAGPDSLAVRGDSAKIQRVVQNLVLNALKYTSAGSVDLSYGAEPGAENARWFVRVRDTGPGFPVLAATPLGTVLAGATTLGREVDRSDVDQTVPRSNLAAPTDHGSILSVTDRTGEGIGLSIVKALCQLLDATLDLDSAAGKGATVTVFLPVDYPDLPEDSPHPYDAN